MEYRCSWCKETVRDRLLVFNADPNITYSFPVCLECITEKWVEYCILNVVAYIKFLE